MSLLAVAKRSGAAATRARLPPGSRLTPPLRPVALPLVLLLLWESLAHSAWANPIFFPSLEQVVARGIRECEGGFLDQLLASLRRSLTGLVLGSTAGTVAGLVIGFSPLAQRLLGPMLLVHRQIALFAWVPLISLWFGGGESGKIAFIAFACFQPSLVNTWQGVAAIPHQYRELAGTWTYGPLDYARFIAFPAALPSIFTGFHTALIYGWTATIGAELLLNIAPGLGGRMNEGQQLFHMDLLLFCLFVLGAVGLLFNLSAAALERRFLCWRAP